MSEPTLVWSEAVRGLLRVAHGQVSETDARTDIAYAEEVLVRLPDPGVGHSGEPWSSTEARRARSWLLGMWADAAGISLDQAEARLVKVVGEEASRG